MCKEKFCAKSLLIFSKAYILFYFFGFLFNFLYLSAIDGKYAQIIIIKYDSFLLININYVNNHLKEPSSRSSL